MNQDQILSAARWALTTLGSVLVARGFVQAPDVTTLITDITAVIGAALPLVAFVWSMHTHKDA